MTNNPNNFFNAIAKPISFFALIALFLGLIVSIFGVQITTCTMGDDDSLVVSLLFFTPITAIFLALSFIGSYQESPLKWLTLPILTIIPFALFFTTNILIEMTFKSNHLCSILNNYDGFNEYERARVSAYWAPVQLLILLVSSLCVYRYWRFNFKGNSNE